MDMINSGQLVYMDDNIYANDTYYEKTNHRFWVETTSIHEPITETKLWQLYDKLQNRRDIDGDKVKLQVNIDGEETNSMISNGYEPE